MTLTSNKEETSAYIQSLSIAEIKAMFANGKPVKMNWSVGDEANDLANNEDYFEKSVITGLPIETLLLIETNTREATFGDILMYCQSLDIDWQSFLIKQAA